MFSNIGSSGGRGGLDDPPETEITRGGEWGGGGEGGCKMKNHLWGEYGNFLEQHISCKIANDGKILTNFKATQAKSLKIVVANSLITKAHAMIIISDIRRLPYRGYTSR